MRLLLDAMGGDYAPKSVIEGAILAKEELSSDVQIVLIGDKDSILSELALNNLSEDSFEIIPSEGVIEMNDHPAKAFSKKPNSSISMAFNLLKNKKVDAFCSAGNTGAMLVGSMLSIKAIEGVIRPGIASFIPNEKTGNFILLLDAGANADCKPDVLAQFGQLGSIYSQFVMGVEKPRIGLMNLGEEEQKGTPTTQAAYQLLKLNENINFIGNIEGKDCFNDKVDVIVCDGFTGNVILKMAESFYNLVQSRNIEDDFFNLFNYEEIGGSPILGVNGTVVIGHGASTPKAIKNMIKMTHQQAANHINSKIKESLYV